MLHTKPTSVKTMFPTPSTKSRVQNVVPSSSRSFSKTAGFTGVRCGYTVVPKELTAATLDGERVSVNKLWNRRQCTKFNGTSYITQRGAEAIYTAEGKAQVKSHHRLLYGKRTHHARRPAICRIQGLWRSQCALHLAEKPDNTGSWRFRATAIQVNVVGTPGVGFGPSGEGYLRLTAFGEREDCIEAMRRIRMWI